DALDVGEELLAGRILLHPVAGPEQGLVLAALAQQPPQFLRLLVDHASSSRMASTYRARPNKSSYTLTRDQASSRASRATRCARRSSTSSASSPPGSSATRAPASRTRVATSPSAPRTSASRGSNCRTAQPLA